jgi:regulatory protein
VAGDRAMTAARTRKTSPREQAMNFLARREHSVAELQVKLAARDFDTAEIEVTVATLVREGLASDERFAEAFTASRKRQGKGPVRIRVELERRGISDELIAACTATDPAQWLELARSVRQKKFGNPPADDYRERARQARFLQYRGFTVEQIRAAMHGDPEQ